MPYVFLIKGTRTWKWVTAHGNSEAEAEINALLAFNNKANDTAVSVYGREDFKCIS